MTEHGFELDCPGEAPWICRVAAEGPLIAQLTAVRESEEARIVLDLHSLSLCVGGTGLITSDLWQRLGLTLLSGLVYYAVALFLFQRLERRVRWDATLELV